MDADGGGDSDQQYATEYWRLDAEAQQRCYELCPEAQGESISLGDLDALCRLMGRPIRDASEQFRLMSELDTTNQMRVLRHDFVSWLLQDLIQERELEAARLHVRENRVVPVAEAVWEEIVTDAGDGSDPPSSPSRFFYNVVTGESKWELPSFVQRLWSHIAAVDARRASMVSDPIDALLRADDHPSNVEMLQDLRALFLKYDDDGSGALDSAEFEDLCVAIGQSLSPESSTHTSTTPLRSLMREVDPFSAQEVVTWDALSYYWTTNAPFQRRTRLAHKSSAWEQIDALHKKNLPVGFRNTDTLAERWNHPEMEQSVVALLLKVVPTTKLDWGKKIALFFDAQLDTASSSTQSSAGGSAGGASSRAWTMFQCARVLLQLGHPMSRRRHLEAALHQLRTKFSAEGDSSTSTSAELREDTVTAWLLHCVRKVEMNGWEELVEPASGQVYYYHEVSGATQWDLPEMETHMTQLLSKFGGTGGSSDERITRIFRHYDMDESGSISFDEFRKFYRALVLGASGSRGGSTVAPSQSSDADELKIRQIFSLLDTGGDGSVSLDEFKVWWRTKLQLEEEETEDAKAQRRTSQRRELCHSFLENAGALVARSSDASIEQLECFESNLLPRLVGVLGKYPLRGLAYRDALGRLVTNAMSQEVELEAFLAWYDGFEAAARAKEEVEEARAKAQAEVLTQELKTKARAKEKQLKAKRRLQLAATEPQDPQSAEEARGKRIESLFRAFDANASGLLDATELQQLTKALGHEMDAAQVQQMLRVMDTSGDGQVTLAEFTTFWTAFQRAESPVKTTPSSSSGAAAAAPPTENLSPQKSPAKLKPRRTSAAEASASLAVSFELTKSRLLKFTLDDFKDVLGDWKDELSDQRRERKQMRAAAESALEEKRQRSVAFVPTRTRRYGAGLDVTWIEPEVVECVAAMIRCIALATRPLLRPDATQTIQRLVRGFATRQHVHRMIETRFQQHVDLHTRHFYYVDRERADVMLERPLFRFERVSSVAPYELEDCDSKHERYAFEKKRLEMRAKKRFFERNRFAAAALAPAAAVAAAVMVSSPAAAPRELRALMVPAAFYVFDVAQVVRERLLGDVWVPLRRQRDFALLELIATRHRRQLRQRSSDGAASLPLHYVVRHADVFPLRVVRAIARGFADALCEGDAFGMTPLHLALRERRASVELLRVLLRQPSGSSSTSLWAMKTRCGDTPMHVAVLHRAPIELLRWVLRRQLVSADAICQLNARGVSPFHLALRGVSESSSAAGTAYARALVLAFLKSFDASQLCGLRTKRGDLPLHLALDAFEARATSSSRCRDLVWLVQLLMQHHPAALLARKAADALLPIHLAIKYRLPPAVTASVWRATLAEARAAAAETPALEWTMLPPTHTTLLHFVVLHQPQALELVRSIVDAMPEACAMTTVPNGDLPLHLVVSSPVVGASGLPEEEVGDDGNDKNALAREWRHHVVRLLCERHAAGCQVYNRQGKLPIHLAIASAQHVDVVRTLLAFAPFALATNPRECNGLRALVLAASAKTADYTVLLALLEVTPAAKLVPHDHLATSTRRGAAALVTPLYAISARPFHATQLDDSAATAAARAQVLAQFCDKFEQIDDEAAHFLEMARARMRRRHHCPTSDWDWSTILRLIDMNPLDEAVIQRAFLAISSKLQALVHSSGDSESENGADTSSSSAGADADTDAAVATVALDPELGIVRRVHQVLYEFPANARVQVIGQRILCTLLPTAFAKAAYRAKIDPYFCLL